MTMTKKKRATSSASRGSSTRSASSSSSSGNSSPSSTSKKDTARSKTKPKSKVDPPKKRSATSRNKKHRHNKRAEAPFPLYRDESKVDVSEGLESIVNLLRGRKNIVVLTGAGISVSCGIPDFRSKGSGLYSTLKAEVSACQCNSTLSATIMYSSSLDILLSLSYRSLDYRARKSSLTGKYFKRTHVPSSGLPETFISHWGVATPIGCDQVTPTSY